MLTSNVVGIPICGKYVRIFAYSARSIGYTQKANGGRFISERDALQSIGGYQICSTLAPINTDATNGIVIRIDLRSTPMPHNTIEAAPVFLMSYPMT